MASFMPLTILFVEEMDRCANLGREPVSGVQFILNCEAGLIKKDIITSSHEACRRSIRLV